MNPLLPLAGSAALLSLFQGSGAGISPEGFLSFERKMGSMNPRRRSRGRRRAKPKKMSLAGFAEFQYPAKDQLLNLLLNFEKFNTTAVVETVNFGTLLGPQSAKKVLPSYEQSGFFESPNGPKNVPGLFTATRFIDYKSIAQSIVADGVISNTSIAMGVHSDQNLYKALNQRMKKAGSYSFSGMEKSNPVQKMHDLLQRCTGIFLNHEPPNLHNTINKAADTLFMAISGNNLPTDPILSEFIQQWSHHHRGSNPFKIYGDGFAWPEDGTLGAAGGRQDEYIRFLLQLYRHPVYGTNLSSVFQHEQNRFWNNKTTPLFPVRAALHMSPNHLRAVVAAEQSGDDWFILGKHNTSIASGSKQGVINYTLSPRCTFVDAAYFKNFVLSQIPDTGGSFENRFIRYALYMKSNLGGAFCITSEGLRANLQPVITEQSFLHDAPKAQSEIMKKYIEMLRADVKKFSMREGKMWDQAMLRNRPF